MSILASQNLWAGDVGCLDDSTEFQHGLPTCVEALELIREPLLMPHVELVKQGLREQFRQRTFVACFSTANDLRAQWDAYADSQQGFVISFDMVVLSALWAPLGLRLMPVEYGKDAQLDRARRAVRRAISDIESALPGLSRRDAVWTVRSRFTLLAAELFFFCASFKNGKYRSEHEWRLIYSRPENESEALPIATRVSGIRAVDYVNVDLRSRFAQHQLPTFAAVRAGPRTEESIRTLVHKYLREFATSTRWELQSAV
jgi:hypothetical protein